MQCVNAVIAANVRLPQGMFDIKAQHCYKLQEISTRPNCTEQLFLLW